MNDAIVESQCGPVKKKVRITLANSVVKGGKVSGVPCACSEIEVGCPKRFTSVRCILKSQYFTSGRKSKGTKPKNRSEKYE